MTTSSILGQFDLCADKAAFPDLDNGYYPVDARIHLFADATRWAMVAELLGYNPRGANLIDVMHRFGNYLTRGGPGFGDFLERVDNMEEIDPDGAEVYVGGVPVVVRGTALRVDAAASTPLEDVFRLLAEGTRSLSWPTRRNCGPTSPPTCPYCYGSTHGTAARPLGHRAQYARDLPADRGGAELLGSGPVPPDPPPPQHPLVPLARRRNPVGPVQRDVVQETAGVWVAEARSASLSALSVPGSGW